MTKQTFKKWIRVLQKAEQRNKKMLSAEEITKDIYILLNKINGDKYEEIIKIK
jgi:hypothetical protein